MMAREMMMLRSDPLKAFVGREPNLRTASKCPIPEELHGRLGVGDLEEVEWVNNVDCGDESACEPSRLRFGMPNDLASLRAL